MGPSVQLLKLDKLFSRSGINALGVQSRAHLIIILGRPLRLPDRSTKARLQNAKRSGSYIITAPSGQLNQIGPANKQTPTSRQMDNNETLQLLLIKRQLDFNRKQVRAKLDA